MLLFISLFIYLYTYSRLFLLICFTILFFILNIILYFVFDILCEYLLILIDNFIGVEAVILGEELLLGKDIGLTATLDKWKSTN